MYRYIYKHAFPLLATGDGSAWDAARGESGRFRLFDRCFDRGDHFGVAGWPLHDIAIINIVWCMAYKRGGGGGAHVAKSAAIVLQ